MSAMADRISCLPDELLCHILSFLPTKQAVATSFLSKRWKPLWPSLSTLRFDDESYLRYRYTYFRFLQFVYTVMLLRDAAKPIKRFFLKCGSSDCNTSTVNTWVMITLRHKVEHLSLSLDYMVELPSCILTSTTLVVLKLRGLSVENVPPSVVFPSLKILHMTWVDFFELGGLFEILSACPVLEDLLISSLRCRNYNGGQLKLALSKLVKADISRSVINVPVEIPVEPFYNVRFLCTEVRVCPSFNEGCTFLNLSHMELAFQKYDWGWFMKLLHQCPNLQVLITSKENCYEINENWVYPEFVPRCLSTQLRRCCVRKYCGGKELEFARYIMQNARVLCSLTISSNISMTSEEKLQMLTKLSLCPRTSATCELSFE